MAGKIYLRHIQVVVAVVVAAAFVVVIVVPVAVVAFDVLGVAVVALSMVNLFIYCCHKCRWLILLVCYC